MRAAALLLTMAIPALAHADIVDIQWNDAAFLHKASIGPKKILEVCGKQKKGDNVVWQFTGNAPTDFNIHYHVGKDVTYPENRRSVLSADGTLSASIDQDYCWMWSNRSAQPVDIEVNFKQAKSGK